MDKTNFYRRCYQQTGWVPMQPLSHPLALGDVCQIHQGRLRPLLNVGQIHLVEPLLASPEIALDPLDWCMNDGVQQIFCELQDTQEDDEHFLWTKQVLEFEQAGSFIFHACLPKAHFTLNWAKIREDATLKLTQLHYSFRQIYLLTAVASASDWALCIAGRDEATLSMSAAVNSSDHFALLSHASAQTGHSKGIAVHEKACGRPAYFFKAKKLVLSDAMLDQTLHHILQHHEQHCWPPMIRLLDTDPLNLLKANELNLTSAIGFFNWVDMSLDDVELLVG